MIFSYNGKKFWNHPDSKIDHYQTSIGKINSKVVALGGYTSSTSYTNTLEVYDVEKDNWKTKTPFPYCSSRLGSRVFKSALIMVARTANP